MFNFTKAGVTHRPTSWHTAWLFKVCRKPDHLILPFSQIVSQKNRQRDRQLGRRADRHGQTGRDRDLPSHLIPWAHSHPGLPELCPPLPVSGQGHCHRHLPQIRWDRTALSHPCSVSQHIRHAATLANCRTFPSFTHFAVEANGQGFNNCICTDSSRLLYCYCWFNLSMINCFQDPLLWDHLSLWK